MQVIGSAVCSVSHACGRADTLFPDVPYSQRQQLRIDDTAAYSVADQYTANQITDIISAIAPAATAEQYTHDVQQQQLTTQAQPICMPEQQQQQHYQQQSGGEHHKPTDSQLQLPSDATAQNAQCGLSEQHARPCETGCRLLGAGNGTTHAELPSLTPLLPLSIVDATACCGGSSISFMARFSHVTAVELDADRADDLVHNLRVMGCTWQTLQTPHSSHPKQKAASATTTAPVSQGLVACSDAPVLPDYQAAECIVAPGSGEPAAVKQQHEQQGSMHHVHSVSAGVAGRCGVCQDVLAAPTCTQHVRAPVVLARLCHTTTGGSVTVVHGDAVQFLLRGPADHHHHDVVFIDPPWGGPGYSSTNSTTRHKQQASQQQQQQQQQPCDKHSSGSLTHGRHSNGTSGWLSDMYLGQQSLTDLCVQLARTCTVAALRLPASIDLEGFTAKLLAGLQQAKHIMPCMDDPATDEGKQEHQQQQQQQQQQKDNNDPQHVLAESSTPRHHPVVLLATLGRSKVLLVVFKGLCAVPVMVSSRSVTNSSKLTHISITCQSGYAATPAAGADSSNSPKPVLAQLKALLKQYSMRCYHQHVFVKAR
eukprot:jgi/Chrzof1/13516/Cz08g00210.t1